ncbi:MAG: hypothetical protein KGI58_01245 [Patescibacteria group bacterium]|nr:hypothetical protein [Patescibacteria group bacterium]
MEEFKPKENIPEKTPPVKDNYIRLYRGETSSPLDSPAPDWLKEQPEIQNRPDGSFFTDSLEDAKHYNKEFGVGDGNITYIDIYADKLEQYRASNNRGKEFSARGMAEKEFFLSNELSKMRQKFIE